MTSRLMKVALNCEQSAAELLIVGAGGGQELVTLGQFYKQWRFTAIDSSQPMLEIAKRRMEEVRVSERVRLVEGTLEQFSAPFLYDGGTCLLVLHFIKELAEKRHFLRQIATKLKPGAPFFLAAINGEPDSLAFSVQMKAWKSHMIAQGISEEEFTQFADSIGEKTNPISGEATVALLAECGFTNINRYFGSYLIEAYLAFRADSNN
jgi:tRNA (cmo5U34)-methyltransferase